MKFKDTFIILSIVAVLTLVGNLVGAKNSIIDSIPGMLILVGISLIGIFLQKVIPLKIPAVAYVVTLACLLTVPGFPGAEIINTFMKKVNFISLTTPILAYVGISLTKDLDEFKKAGWRIVVVACFVFIGTYIGSAIIAEVILRAMGQI